MQDNTPAAHGFTELVVDFEEMIFLLQMAKLLGHSFSAFVNVENFFHARNRFQFCWNIFGKNTYKF